MFISDIRHIYAGFHLQLLRLNGTTPHYTQKILNLSALIENIINKSKYFTGELWITT